MKELIKRPYISYFSNKETVEAALAGTLFSDWYDEVGDKNSFFYRFSAQLHSTMQDVLKEQVLFFSEFMYSKLDVTQGSYAINVDPNYTVALDQIRFRTTPFTDHLIGDVYLMGRVVEDLGQEEQRDIDTLRELFGAGKFSILSLEDINQIDSLTQRYEQIVNGLLPGEVLLSGERVAATNRGRVVSFDPNDAPFIAGELTATYEALITGQYILLDPLTIASSMNFYDQDEELLEVPPENAIIGLIEASTNYTDFYDEDKDGYISQEDIQQLTNKIGVSINDVSEEIWAKDYAKYDRGNKGRIVQSDIEPSFALLGAVRETAFVIRNPFPGTPVFVRYEAYTEPYYTYVTPERRVAGGTLGLTEILDEDLDIRLADGFAFNSNNYVVGVNLSRNEIWFGRKIDTQYALRKVSYPHQSNLQIRGFTFIDDVAFFVLQATNGFLYKDLYNVVLLRLDTLREVVEITTDIVPIKGVNLDPAETVTGCSITDRKDKIRFFTDFGQIVTVKLERASLTLAPNGNPVATPDLADEIPPSQLLNNVKLFNAIDNYAFNAGLIRIPFETNEELLERIKKRIGSPFRSGLEEITKGSAFHLGLWLPAIYSRKVIEVWNNIDPEGGISIEIKRVTNASDPLVVLLPFTRKERTVSQKQYIGNTVENVASEGLLSVYYENEDGDMFEGKKLILGRATLQRLCEAYIKTNPKTILKAPNFDEEIVYVQNLPAEITYSTIDPDGVFHGDITEEILLDLPTIDSMKYYPPELERIGTTEEKPIHLSSKTADLALGYYALHDPLTREFFGNEHWEEIINYIRSLDKTKWRRTEPGISAYDEKYASENIIRKSLFNQGEYSFRQIEVSL